MVTLLHVSDIHLNPIAFDVITRLVPQFRVDLVVDTGDVTTWGTEVRVTTLSRVAQVGVPYVFVRGNHDSRRTQKAVAASRNAVVLDGDVVEVAGVMIAGIGDPIFTPDVARNTPNGVASTPTSSGVTPTGTSGPASSPGPATSPGPAIAAPDSASGEQQVDPELRAGHRLAGLIRRWDDAHPDKPVTIAAVHEPYASAAAARRRPSGAGRALPPSGGHGRQGQRHPGDGRRVDRRRGRHRRRGRGGRSRDTGSVGGHSDLPRAQRAACRTGAGVRRGHRRRTRVGLDHVVPDGRAAAHHRRAIESRLGTVQPGRPALVHPPHQPGRPALVHPPHQPGRPALAAGWARRFSPSCGGHDFTFVP